VRSGIKFWEEIHFYGDKILVFTICLKQNFWAQYNWPALPWNALIGYAPACKAKFSHLDKNIAALCCWLNSSKSDDSRNNAFGKSTKCKHHELLVTTVTTLQEVRINAYFIFDS